MVGDEQWMKAIKRRVMVGNAREARHLLMPELDDGDEGGGSLGEDALFPPWESVRTFPGKTTGEARARRSHVDSPECSWQTPL